MSDAPIIPDFELLRPIGRGAFGVVWLARNRTTGQHRAVKVVPRTRGESGDPARREIVSITRLEENVKRRHEHLIDIQHVGRTDDHLFYVMALADNAAPDGDDYEPETLERKLQDGPIDTRSLLQYAEQLLGAIAHLHASGVIHRDVKPSNCLFVDGKLKLADFGLLTDDHALASRIGTRTYMPPDGRMDARADVFAAGLVLYEMMSGYPADAFPRMGERGAALIDDVDLAALQRIVLRACESNRADRFADGQAMLDALHAARKSLARRPRPLPLASTLLGAFALSAVAVGLYFLVMNSANEPSLDASSPPAPQAAERATTFLTDPFEAEILLDGELLIDERGAPYHTPCTVTGLPSEPATVEFLAADGRRIDLGVIDLAEAREIEASW